MKNYLLAAVAAMSVSEVMTIRAEAVEGRVSISVDADARDWRDTGAALVLGGASAANLAHLFLSSAAATAPGGIVAARIGASILGGAGAVWFIKAKPFLNYAARKLAGEETVEGARTAIGNVVDRAAVAAQEAARSAKDKVKSAVDTARDKTADALEGASEKVRTNEKK